MFGSNVGRHPRYDAFVCMFSTQFGAARPRQSGWWQPNKSTQKVVEDTPILRGIKLAENICVDRPPPECAYRVLHNVVLHAREKADVDRWREALDYNNKFALADASCNLPGRGQPVRSKT